MAEKTKSQSKPAAKQAKQVEPKSGGATKKGGGATDLNVAYRKLRTYLDAIEHGSVKYFATGANDAEKIKRFNKLKTILMLANDQIDKLTLRSSGSSRCDPDFLCDGVCVPYPCPVIDNRKSSK